MSRIHPELESLVDPLLNGSISPQDKTRLEELLLASEEARRNYLLLVQFDASLQAYADANEQNIFRPMPKTASLGNSEPLMGFSSVVPAVLLSSALLLLAGVVGFMFWATRSIEPGPAQRMMVVSSTNVLPKLELQKDQLISGPVRFERGVLALSTEGGALISLQGPCDFEMVDVNVGRLLSGRLVAFCGADAEKLTVETPNGKYIDIGTEFGVSVADQISNLHVFDGQVMAENGDPRGQASVLVEATSRLETKFRGPQTQKGLVDFVAFDELRQSLSDRSSSNEFDDLQMAVQREPKDFWEVNKFQVDELSARVEAENPLATGLGSYLQLNANTRDVQLPRHQYSFASVQLNYGDQNDIDLTKAHTIECVIRLDCPPENVRDLSMFGGNDPTWKNRSWRLSSVEKKETQMWSVYYGRNTESHEKYQYLVLHQSLPYHLLVEIDPEIGCYRASVSDGKRRIWSELFDGSPVKVKSRAGKLGKLFWQIRGYPGKQVAFSIDAVRIRNRPVFESRK